MSAILDMTSFNAALKQHYIDLTVKNLVYRNNPLLALLAKDEKFGGSNLPLPMIYGNPQGRSASFSSALANKSASQMKAFTLTRASDYSLANIDNQTIEASAGDSDAFMRAATTEIDGAINSLTRSLAIALYRNGTGTIGQVSSSATVSASSVALADKDSVTNFEVGMTIRLSSGDGSGIRTGSIVITSVDRNNGIIGFGGALTGSIAAAAASDYISMDGDFNAKISGLDAWLPISGPTSTPFFGVDRTADPVRMAGVAYNAVGVPIEEAFIEGSARIGREGGNVTHALTSFSTYSNLEKALGSKVIYTDLKTDVQVGFRGISIMGTKGPITVVPDQNCQSDRAYLLQLDTWKLFSLGAAPKLLKSDGMEFLRVSNADAVEVRVGYYAQLGCVAPGYNGVIKLA